MRTVICVAAHAGEQAVFDRDFHLWQRHNGWNIVVASPSDAPVRCDGKYLLTYPSTDKGKSHIRRWRQLLTMLVTMEDADRFVLFEPDSFCMSQLIPLFYVIGKDRVKHYDHPVIAGNIRSGLPTHRLVSATHYVLHPIILTRAAVRSLVGPWRGLPDDFEGGHSDRAIFRLAQEKGVRMVDFHRYGLGYGHIRIFPSEYMAMKEAIFKGATMIHGLKEAQELAIVPNLPIWDGRKWAPRKGNFQIQDEYPVVDEHTACWLPGDFYGYLLKDLAPEFVTWFLSKADLHEQYPEMVVGLRK